MKYADFEFVRRCITSCITYSQLGNPISNLIKLFHVKYNDNELVNLLYNYKHEHLLKLQRLYQLK